MDELIIRVFQGTASEEEEAMVADWRRENLANKRYHRELVDLWKLTGVAEPRFRSGTRSVPPPSYEIVQRSRRASHSSQSWRLPPSHAERMWQVPGFGFGAHRSVKVSLLTTRIGIP